MCPFADSLPSLSKRVGSFGCMGLILRAEKLECLRIILSTSLLTFLLVYLDDGAVSGRFLGGLGTCLTVTILGSPLMMHFIGS